MSEQQSNLSDQNNSFGASASAVSDPVTTSTFSNSSSASSQTRDIKLAAEAALAKKRAALLSPEESAHLAHVSVETINQYSLYGLLRNASTSPNEAKYDADEVASLFHINLAGSAAPTDRSTSNQSLSTPADSAVAAKQAEKHTDPTNGSAGAADLTVKTEQSKPILDPEETPSSAEQIATPEPATENKIASEPKAEATSAASSSSVSHPPSVVPDPSTALRALSLSPNTIELYEVNGLLREQLQAVKQERDWLRERLEKLEVRTERDQMLMLTNSDTVRTLLRQSDEAKKKRGFFSGLIPWMRS